MSEDIYTAKPLGFRMNHVAAIFQPVPYRYNRDAGAFVQENLEHAERPSAKIDLLIPDENDMLELEGWLTVSASTFQFWDNELDAEYEQL
jgi:hypothetical protein